MKKIKLDSTTHKSADIIVDELKKRARKQNRIYTIAFTLISLLITCYILNAISVDEYDGYISHKDIKIRAVNNIAIVDFYVKPGDIVNEGDTLYSELVIDWLEAQVNPLADDVAGYKITESDLRIAKYESEIIELNNTIYTLHQAANDIEEDIRSGVKTDDAMLVLNLELKDRLERSKHIRRAIRAEYDMQKKYTYNISNTKSLISQSLSERRANLDKFGSALKHRVAYVDSKIVDIKATQGMITVKNEDVLTFQPIGHPNMTDSHIEMFVDANKYKDIDEGMEVEVYAGGKFLCTATVSLLGVRMADAYSNIELLIDRSTDINGKLAVPLIFKEDYELPEKYYIHNYPVEIKHRKWEGRLKNPFYFE